jgi:site-specific DNA-methyltransferase (adenine-specific)
MRGTEREDAAGAEEGSLPIDEKDTRGSYRLLPDLPPWKYTALKASIERYGVLVPVVKDEHGTTIDGHQRERACRELGIKNFPIITQSGLSEEEKRDQALVLNLVRRNLSRKQLRQVIAAELRRTPDIASNWLAQVLGTSDKTVEAVRQELIATSEIPKFEQHWGRDGKRRRVPRIVTHTARNAERAQEVLQVLSEDAPARPMELRLAERRAKRKQSIERVKGKAVGPPGEGDIRLFHCRFQQLEAVAKIEPGSVNLILTDPPYGKDFLDEIADLGSFAERVLIEGGLLALYYGQSWLNKLQAALGTHLTYRWMISSQWQGDGNPVYIGEEIQTRVISQWKPIVVFSKGGWKRDRPFNDLLFAPAKEKSYHPWQQPLTQVEDLICTFSDPGDLVIDPCGGGFTTVVACHHLGRRCISCDSDPASVILGQERLAEEQGGLQR